ncbi:hypothetical protein YC2023_062333 [Brassica napus]
MADLRSLMISPKHSLLGPKHLGYVRICCYPEIDTRSNEELIRKMRKKSRGVEGEDEFREVYACPFCSDYFDIVSLCCHIDEDHPMDTLNGANN